MCCEASSVTTVPFHEARNPDRVNEERGNLEYSKSDEADVKWQWHTLDYGYESAAAISRPLHSIVRLILTKGHPDFGAIYNLNSAFIEDGLIFSRFVADS